MLKNDKNYPYPLLRSYNEDYTNSIFNGDIKVYPVMSDERGNGYKIDVEYNVNNKEIMNLIEDNKMIFALQIRCSSTWKNSFIRSKNTLQEIFLNAGDVNNSVELCPCIIAIDDIDDFTNSDFADEFAGGSYFVGKGQVVGIGDSRKFDAVYEDDLIKHGTIVTISENTENDYMSVNLDADLIEIHLPSEQYAEYYENGQYCKGKVDLINGICIVPALVQCIMEIKHEIDDMEEVSDYSEYAWYKTVNFLLYDMVNGNDAEYRKLFDTPVTTVQKLLKNNSYMALKSISDM